VARVRACSSLWKNAQIGWRTTAYGVRATLLRVR